MVCVGLPLITFTLCLVLVNLLNNGLTFCSLVSTCCPSSVLSGAAGLWLYLREGVRLVLLEWKSDHRQAAEKQPAPAQHLQYMHMYLQLVSKACVDVVNYSKYTAIYYTSSDLPPPLWQ